MISFTKRCGRSAAALLMAAVVCGAWRPVAATDYFLTIGGGYEPAGNQASLEANVVFFQQLLADKHPDKLQHDVYFADGDDPADDLQIVSDEAAEALPATELLATLHRRRTEDNFAYRTHRVANIAGALDPKLIRERLESLAKTATDSDRLIVYVTAHGGAGPAKDAFNTTIDCWNGKKIKARDFTKWLDKLPPKMPVVMVMAQCYCGGFGHAIFEDFDEAQGLAAPPRAGFFAQQHDLQAAGCRPDIEHDQEFSSYFWGAIAGRSRNGVLIEGCDINGDGTVSFAEAYAYAVTDSETIDIPLRTSEVLLREYSRLADDEAETAADAGGTSPPAEDGDQPKLLALEGKLHDLIERASPVQRRIVERLAKSNGLTLQIDMAEATKLYEESRRAVRSQGRGRSRQSSGRRELLQDIIKKWPELGDRDEWQESPLLKPENQATLLAEIKELPSWKRYDERRQQREDADKGSDLQEIRQAKLRRLVSALELIVLEANLPQVATPEIVERYQKLVALEETSLIDASPK